MTNFKGISVGLLLVAMLPACGGGGGGGGGIGVALQPLAIDDTNAMQVSAAVLDASAAVVDVGEPGGPIAGVVVEEDSAEVDLAKIVRAYVDLFSVLHEQTAVAQITGVVIPPTKELCLVSGSVTISGEIADPQLMTFMPGDTLTAVFNSCDDGDGFILNGTMAFVVVSSVGTIDLDPNSDNLFIPPYNYTFDATLTKLSIRENVSGSTFTVNGDMTLQEDSVDGLFINSEFSGNSLKVTTPVTTDTLTDYQILSTLDQNNANAYSTDGKGTLASTLLGGIVEFLTTTPFAGFGTDFPDSGQMDITGATVVGGAGPSSVTVFAVNSQCVRLLVDPNGDGVTSDIITTWESLPTGVPVDCPA
jgi:hypothetical protein